MLSVVNPRCTGYAIKSYKKTVDLSWSSPKDFTFKKLVEDPTV